MQADQKAVVLEDEHREPTEDEVLEYAEFLGIDPENEPHLLWIAKEGVVAPVPHPWKVCTENQEDVFYFNFETGESVWDHPCDEVYRKMAEDARAGKVIERPGGSASASKLGISGESPSSLMSPSLPGMDSELPGRQAEEEDFDGGNDFDRSEDDDDDDDDDADVSVKAEEFKRCQEPQQASNAQGNTGTEVFRQEVSEDESISECSMENESQHEHSFSRSKKSSRSGRSSRSRSSSSASSVSRKGSYSAKDLMDGSLSGGAGAVEEPLNSSKGSLSISGAAELGGVGAAEEQLDGSKGSLSLSGVADRDSLAPGAAEDPSEHSKGSLSAVGVTDRTPAPGAA